MQNLSIGRCLSEIELGEVELMKATNNCIAITNKSHCSTWLYGLNDAVSNLIFVEPDDRDRISSLIGTVDVGVALVHLPSQDKEPPTVGKQQQLNADLTMIEGLISIKPSLAVIALVETMDQSTVLPIIRSGARDIIQIGTPAHEVQAVIRRHQKHSMISASPQLAGTGHIYTLLNSRMGDGNALFSIHMALEMQRRGPTLLLDLGNPSADIMLIMGLTSKFSLLDVIHNRSRLDATLIETGFARHDSGLSLLSMPDGDRKYSELAPADLHLILYALKRHFKHIFINLSGITNPELLKSALSQTTSTFLLAEQTIPSCKRNHDLLESLRQQKISLPDSRLIIDRHLSDATPSALSIAESFGMPLGGTLPGVGQLRLSCINTGESMFDKMPNSSYVSAIKKLVHALPDMQSMERPKQAGNLLSQLKNALQRLRSNR
ncbi:MAG: hypothetical protein CVU15_06270 [Betaproteobacteria bacterium HGW-Betaproteobacteria-1]|jgi:pilus assembly protein CpaE|nr:MAG: hypothetical protein CVU15_06270 [Betaproteobacteria bacterium HGW-Betaproteobacteria-1]